MFLLSWTLTYLVGDTHLTLESLTYDANPSLGRFLDHHRDYNISILYVDFFADARPTDLSIMMNR
jgi:hypothetical protein